jgi:hypothetical protein
VKLASSFFSILLVNVYLLEEILRFPNVIFWKMESYSSKYAITESHQADSIGKTQEKQSRRTEKSEASYVVNS